MTTTELTTLLTGLWAKVKSHVTTAINGLATKSELANYCPIIEDGRSSAALNITANAPFDELVDGQRILLHFKYGAANGVTTLTLNLSNGDGDTTNAIPMSYVSQGYIQNQLRTGAIATIGAYVEFIYDETNSRWITAGYDVNSTYYGMSQAILDAGTSTNNNLVAATLLRDNFYLKSEVNSLNPIIEDTRTSAAQTITGVAPFATLTDKQRITIRLAKDTGNYTKVNLTLSGGTETGEIPVYTKTYNTGIGQVFSQSFLAGTCMELLYTASTNRWMCLNLDRDTTGWKMLQSDINNVADTDVRAIPTAKLLRDNFYLKSETNALVAGKQDKRTVEKPTYTADWEYVDNGSPFTSQQLADELDLYYSDWRNEAAAATLYNALIEGNDASAVTLSFNAFGAFVAAATDLDTFGYDSFIYQNSVKHYPSLTPINYVKLGITDSVSPTIANVDYTEADEFIFTFTCESASPTITLPQGVALADGFDWSEAAAGVVFEVSIRDGKCAYLCVTPTNS